MGISAKNIDRLLPRHEAAELLDLDWHVHTERDGFFKKAEVCTPAVMRDISLEGALVEVTSAEKHAVGDRIAVRFEGFDAEAVVRHVRSGEDDRTYYGVRFIADSRFKDAIDLTVGALRGHSDELAAAWQRQN